MGNTIQTIYYEKIIVKIEKLKNKNKSFYMNHSYRPFIH